MPTVSIIVPVYNSQSYLRKCIDSLLSQTYSDFEILLINDGSKDQSGYICDEYAKKDNRIRVIHKANGGVSSARNRGLDEARGKYIMFCDGDDSVKPIYCEALVNLAKDYDDCLVIGGVTILNDNRPERDMLCDEYPLGETATLSNQAFCDLYVKLNLHGNFQLLHMPTNKLFSRRIIEDYGLRFDPSIHYNEDIIFNLRYLEKTEYVKIFNKPIYNYYTSTPDSACKRYFPDIYNMFRIKEDILKTSIINKATDKKAANTVWYTLVFNDTNRAINNTLSKANLSSNKEKIKYCTSLIRDKRFREALKYADTSEYNKLYVFALRLRSGRLINLIKKVT